MEVTGVFPRLRPLPPVGPLRSLGSSKLPGHSGVQLQVSNVFLDPVLTGVGTDLPAFFGLEAVERNGRVTHWEVQQGNPGPAVAFHPTLCWAAQGLLTLSGTLHLSQSRELFPLTQGAPQRILQQPPPSLPFPLGWASPCPDSASPWPGQTTSQRPGSCTVDRTCWRTGPFCAPGHCPHSTSSLSPQEWAGRLALT